MSTVGATNCAARMDIDFTDYGLRSIMDHDLDYDNNVFPPSPPQPQDSAGSPQDSAMQFRIVLAPVRFRIVRAPMLLQIVRALTVSVLKNSSRPRIVRALE